MRFSIASQVLCGAVAVSASAVPKRAQSFDLSQFGSFDMISPEEAKAGLDEELASQDDTISATAEDIDLPINTQATCENPIYRVEWRNMSHEERTAFLDAILRLMALPSSGAFPGATSRYEDLVAVHQLSTSTIHMSGLFLPWHRYYLWTFARLLREEAGFTGPFPWWDEVQDAGNFVGSGLFTDEYFGSLPGATNGAGTCITNGKFGGLTLNIGTGSTNAPHCLARAVNETLTGYITQSFVDSCNGRSSYADMESCSEMGPHAYGHNGVGAVMAEVSASPGDPIFFMHHTFVDRMWRKWQIVDPANRISAINGCATPGENCEPLTLDTVLTSRGLRPDVTVRDMMEIYADPLCYLYDY